MIVSRLLILIELNLQAATTVNTFDVDFKQCLIRNTFILASDNINKIRLS